VRIYPIDPNVLKFWKSYPVRFPGGSVSACCNEPTVLVQSMSGGFVTRNCPKCGTKDTLPEDVFLRKLDIWVACPSCRRRMEPTIIDKNYGFICRSCELGIYLAALLPRWQDIAT
jgi:endogenous inhibitor of DNA gyrase (YacG/DUF329 family)